MTSKQLVWNRFKENWKYQWSVVRSVIDWTVFVYLILPAVVIFLFTYRSWWLELPEWSEHITLPIVFALFFLFLWRQHFRTFIQEPDRIFLKKHERLFLGMKKGGIILSYIKQMLTILFLCLLIAPFWFQHLQLTGVDMVFFASLWLSVKWLVMGIKGRLDVTVRGWRSFFRGIPLVFGVLFLWEMAHFLFKEHMTIGMLFFIFFNVMISVLLVKRRFTSTHHFDHDLAIEQLEKTKWIHMIFQFSWDIEKVSTQSNKRNKPFLFPKSNRLFKKRTPTNGFLELFIKVIARDRQYILAFLQIVGITTGAIFVLPPLWLKIGMAFSGILFLLSWLNYVWQRVVGTHPFTRKYVEKEGFFIGKRIVTTVVIIPFILWITCAVFVTVWIERILQI